MIKSDDTGKLILRLTLGILILLHGLFKLSGGGVGGIAGMLSSHGLPGFRPMASTSAKSWRRSCSSWASTPAWAA